jgi:hypothetical protein
MPVISVFERQRQEDVKFEASLAYIARHYRKKRKNNANVLVHTYNPSY